MSKLEQISISTSEDHIKRIAKGTTPLEALKEIIYNSIDAGASIIDIKIVRNPLGGLESASVHDDGEGISIADVEEVFGKLGESKKTSQTKNSKGKYYHGQLGEGRFKAYALGNRVQWLTKTEVSESIKIVGNIGSIKKFDISQIMNGQEKHSKGTVFTAFDEGLNCKFPADESLIENLTKVFSINILSDEDLKIILNGKTLDPNENISVENQEKLEKPYETTRVRTIVWKTGNNENNLFWCDEDFNTRAEENIKIESGLPYSIFLASPAVKKSILENTFELRKGTELAVIKDRSLTVAEKFLRKIEDDTVYDKIKQLKDEKVYPYEEEPRSKIEKISRDVFNVCAVKIIERAPNIIGTNKNSKVFTLQLLKQAIENSPETVKNIFNNVLKLSETERNDFSTLLERVSLSGLIKMGKEVTNRLDFLKGLRELVLNEDFKKVVRERSELHKIVEKETWMLGEDYSLGCSDEALTSVLKQHRSILKHSSDEVVEADQSMAQIPDLVLGKQYRVGHENHLEHLVVELKRPSVKIGMDEKSQIEKYAAAVSKNDNFDKSKTIWKFYVISSSVDEYADEYRSKESNNFGEITGIKNTQGFRIFIKTWGEILQEAEGRLNFLLEKLEIKSSSDYGRQFLKEKYSEIIGNIKKRKNKNI